jgi:hypothetical protein
MQSTTVNGQTWPVMPALPALRSSEGSAAEGPFPAGNPLSIAQYPFWVAANNGSPRLIDKIKGWIEQNGKFDDTPGL